MQRIKFRWQLFARWFAVALLICFRADAQSAEPILTWNAVPNPAGVASVKLDFVSPLGETSGTSTQAIPESRLELGLGHGLETVFQMPLLRASEPDGSSVLGGGQLSVALRYLLVGSQSSRFAMSVAGRLEVPTGDSTLVGNATQLMAMVLSEWHVSANVALLSNIAWNTSVGATTGRFANFEHSHAVVWSRNRFVMPVFEVAGTTSTVNGNSQVVVQPEVIVVPIKHLELKTGLSVALVPTPHYGIRSQLAWIWGKGSQ
jgi:hypothetical protein